MIERHLDQRLVRKEPGQLAADRRVHAVVVVGVEEAALPQIAAQGARSSSLQRTLPWPVM